MLPNHARTWPGVPKALAYKTTDMLRSRKIVYSSLEGEYVNIAVKETSLLTFSSGMVFDMSEANIIDGLAPISFT